MGIVSKDPRTKTDWDQDRPVVRGSLVKGDPPTLSLDI